MALSTISGTTGITDATITSAKLADFSAAVDLNGVELLLDADQDTSITADTDDRIDFKIAGVEHISISNSSGDTIIKPMVNAKDIVFQQYDGNKILEINDGNYVAISGAAAGPGELRFYEDTDLGSHYTGLKAGNATASVSYVLPLADGTDGYQLTTDGSGTLSWAAAGANPPSADGDGLGTASLEWSDLYLADGGVIYFGNDQDVTLTHVADTGILLNSTMAIQFNDSSQYINAPSNAILDINATDEIELNATLADVNANLDVSGTIVGASTISGTTITASTAFVPDASDGAALGTTALEFSDLFLADGAVIQFGDDQDVSLTHVADTGLLLSSTDKLQFNDASQFIHGSSATVLSIGATDEIDLTATAIDINGTVNMSGVVTVQTGIIPDAADGAYLGTASAEWSDLFLADSGTVTFGNDQDTILTHTDGTGLTLNSTNKLCFNDASQFVQGSSATVLSIGATDEIDLTATAVDLNGTLNVSGVATFQATPVFPDGSLAIIDLDIDGGTDIGAAIVDADLFIVDDGAGGANRKTVASRIKTYVNAGNAVTALNNATANELVTVGSTTTELDCEANLTWDDNYLELRNSGDGSKGIKLDANRGAHGDTLGPIEWQWNNTTVAKIESRAGPDTTNKDDAHLSFYTTASGGSLTERMKINHSGVLGIGPSTDGDLGTGIHIKEADSGASVSGNADLLVLETAGTAPGITFLSDNTEAQHLYFGDPEDNDIGQLSYYHGDNTMRFTAGANKVFHLSASTVVVNEDSDAVNFRVETNGRTEGIYTTADNLSSGTTVDAGTLYAASDSSTGLSYEISGFLALVRNGVPLRLNNSSGDGDIMSFSSAGNVDGTISISGSTVSYNAFSGSHWSRLADNSKPTILRGTVMESIATMMDWYQVELKIPKIDSGTNEQEIDEDDNLVFTTIKKSIALPVGKSVGDDHTVSHEGADYTGKILKEDNEQLPMCKISDTEDSKGVYGVFSAWDDADEGLDGDVNDMLVTALGAFLVRVHKDETVAIGDYLQSRGDGTAKVQADDILRASTIGKVTSTTKTHTHADDSYCVPCTLHCG